MNDSSSASVPYCCGGSHVLNKNARMRICQDICTCFYFIFVLPQQDGTRVLYFERNKTFSIPATNEQSDFGFLRNKFLTAFGFRPMQDHTSFDEEFGEFFDTEDDAVFANKTKRRSTPRSSR